MIFPVVRTLKSYFVSRTKTLADVKFDWKKRVPQRFQLPCCSTENLFRKGNPFHTKSVPESQPRILQRAFWRFLRTARTTVIEN